MNKEKKYVVEFFNFWEVNRIGLNITNEEGELLAIDLTLNEAKYVLSTLDKAINSFEETENNCKDYFGE